MNRLDRKKIRFIRDFLFTMFCFSLEVFSDNQTRFIEDDSVPYFINKFKQISFKYIYPIYRIYEVPKSVYVILTEHPYDTTGSAILNDSIQAFCIRITGGKYSQKWVLKDYIVRNPNNGVEERSIWFWSKYIQIKDFDRDGETDFIIVYGTKGLNGIDDGRLKILIFHKDQKFAIRHLNGVLDFERQTQIDNSFYSLPKSIQESVIDLIESIIQDGNAIFATGWKESFECKRTLITETIQNPPPKKAKKKNQNGQYILQQR